jgi:hypothetical protein
MKLHCQSRFVCVANMGVNRSQIGIINIPGVQRSLLRNLISDYRDSHRTTAEAEAVYKCKSSSTESTDTWQGSSNTNLEILRCPLSSTVEILGNLKTLQLGCQRRRVVSPLPLSLPLSHCSRVELSATGHMSAVSWKTEDVFVHELCHRSTRLQSSSFVPRQFSSDPTNIFTRLSGEGAGTR